MATFFFADRAFVPVSIAREEVRRYVVPMSPPVYEVRLRTTLGGPAFRGTSVASADVARREALRRTHAYVRRHAFMCAELKEM